MSESREDVQSRLRAGGTPSIRGEQADWGGRMPPDCLRLTWRLNLTDALSMNMVLLVNNLLLLIYNLSCYFLHIYEML